MRFIFPEPWNFIYFWKQLLYSFMFPPEFHWTDTCWCKKSVEVGSLSHYLQGLGYARLCKISSITSMSNFTFGSSTESAVRFQPIGESVENAIRWLSLSPLDSRKIVRILRFTTLRLERENISHLSRESRKIIDSKVPASKGICDRSQEGQISGQGIFLAINFIFWYCWWKIPANQSDMVNITMIYRVFFPPSKRFFGPWDFWSINVVWCWSTDMAQGIKLKYDEKNRRTSG